MQLRDLRWCLLAVFLVGDAICQAVLGPLPIGFHLLTAADLTACAILLSRLSKSPARTIWVWITLLLLLDAYFVRMYWFVYHFDHPAYINTYFLELRWVTRSRILSGYAWSTVGFVLFCLTASAVITFTPATGPRSSASPGRTVTSLWTGLVIFATLSYLLASVLQFRAGFGLRGVAPPSLPFHLGTVVLLARQQVIPALLVLALWVFDTRDRLWTMTTLGAIFACAIIDTLISASRGDLLTLTGPVFVLWIVTGRFSRRRISALAIVVVCALLLVPITSAYRNKRLGDTGSPGSGSVSWGALAQSAVFLGNRIGDGGVDAVWGSLDHKGDLSVERALTYLRPGHLNDYYTRQVVGVSDPNDHRDAGMFGAFVLIGGAAGLCVLTVALVLLLSSAWMFLSRLRTWPVALALASASFAEIAIDSTDVFLTLVKLAIPVIACEIVYRRLARPQARLQAEAPLHVPSTT